MITSHPEDVTHVHYIYGTVHYYRRVIWWHLNQVSGKYQPRSRWDWWNGTDWVEDQCTCSRNFVEVARGTPQVHQDQSG